MHNLTLGIVRILRFLTGKKISEYALILVLRITCVI